LAVSGYGNQRQRPKQKYATSVPKTKRLILLLFNFFIKDMVCIFLCASCTIFRASNGFLGCDRNADQPNLSVMSEFMMLSCGISLWSAAKGGVTTQQVQDALYPDLGEIIQDKIERNNL